MPHIVLFEDNRAASFLRRGLYAEVVACVEAAERRIGSLQGVSEGELILLARLLISKCAALVRLGRYFESGAAARRASTAIGLLTRGNGPRSAASERIPAQFGSLLPTLDALQTLVEERRSILEWFKTAPHDAELRPRAASILESMAICEPEAVEAVNCLLKQLAEENIEGDCRGTDFMDYLAPDSLSTRTHKRSKYIQ